jgi:hypothetical protein
MQHPEHHREKGDQGAARTADMGGKPPFARLCLSVGSGGQLAQLRFQEIEVDGFGEELGGAEFASAAAALVVTIGGHHP